MTKQQTQLTDTIIDRATEHVRTCEGCPSCYSPETLGMALSALALRRDRPHLMSGWPLIWIGLGLSSAALIVAVVRLVVR